ncbi:Ser Thr protein phosphatase family protein [Pyrenophora tritici-repentis]|uniref:Metallophos domain containing protein n=2 Tax=Pyrenophora tritici-repentis TaxID=45151 RepID=A0A2W1EF86_9PLEO|nr:Ser/Thr protein phosphatase family protein [Pyrenophora tritici-repentis Pt-1C-BFP]KAA8616606.1 ser/Thr protein phosphatase family protein [Pyrenophora tritici-repentis]EDU50963.1 Ser/Thr protein phosphatase family protein [Pyrenophora tritici-repentis Pt-1C-BFP]KAF7445865.1 ser/Thr protein phosphatase family protein [Pyrenophora tritici-repentis]KAF7566994.1 Metallophos domain containing protein [Pyrenophora tritici-repentis]KAG9381579.1 ser/Thr protein phosphatase family protein [Pyrenoph
MAGTIRLLITSDTHGAWPYSLTNPAPKADVLLHCGDLTQVGGLSSFKRAIEDIKSSDAELKLIIAGNHDLELEDVWGRENIEDEEDLEERSKCVAFMQSHKSHGIHYLEEGTHQFVLQDGRQFTVYASPYSPEFNGYAFAYEQDEDRFNVGGNSVPANINILMTHGPLLFPTNPEYQLDVSHDGKHCGCKKLADAVQRTKPRLHCFGHIHEGRGALRVSWADSEKDKSQCVSMERVQDNGAVVEQSTRSESLLVNAAMDGPGKGWLVDLAL